jgi:hypothetical protein
MITIPIPPPSGTFNAFGPAVHQKKSFSPYLIVAGVVILVLGFGYYFYFYGGLSLFETPVFPAAPPLTAVDIKISQMSPLPFDLFDSSFYKSLKSYGNLPIVVDSLGRLNPFIPY